MIKLETHCHSLGGSPCAEVKADIIVDEYKKAGYGGIVLTNHYSYEAFDAFGLNTKKEKLDRFFSLVNEMRECCEKNGLKSFYGVESRVVVSGVYAEYMLYGFDEKFLYDNKYLYEYTQEELFRLADKNNVFMYQTHPYRRWIELGNPKFMHGAESFNGHFHHTNNNDLAERFCKENGLIQMSGSDYHHQGQPLTAGIWIPENINDNFALTDYIRSGKAELIRDNELYLTKLKEYKIKRFGWY